MRVNRLLEMTTLLLKSKAIPAKEFAGRFGVSLRTIYRDVEELSAAGVPVYMNRGKGGGIALLDTFTFDKTLVSSEEIDSLMLALKTLQATQYPQVEHFLARLEALFKHSASSDWVQIEFSPWGSQPDEDNKFMEIKQAILGQKVIDFDYIDGRGAKSHRQIEPMQVIFKSHAWYVWGYCLDRCDFRTFRLSRIKQLRVGSTTFERRAQETLGHSEKPPVPKPLTPVTLSFTPEVLQRVYDDFNPERITSNPDGSCLVTLDLIEDEWTYGMILSYGCFVEVLSPAHLRATIAERLKKALQIYGVS